MSKIRKCLSATLNSGPKLWGLFFLYPFFVSLFIQLILLPYIFPHWMEGDGLLKGGDWYSFHRLAASLAENIESSGWSAWELAPANQAPAGIAAVFYALFIPKPWVLIPFNAAFHATATFLLVKILRFFVANRKIAVLAALPFWLYPSAMSWYAQIHKDSYSIAGFLLFLYGWLGLMKMRERFFWQVIASLIAMSAGALLVCLVRAYALEMLQCVFMAIALLTTIVTLYRVKTRSILATQGVLCVVLSWAVVFGIIPIILNTLPRSIRYDIPGIVIHLTWQKTGWPGPIESRGYRLAMTREHLRLGYPQGLSSVDSDVSFHQVKDLILYLPRAAELGLFAPFPAAWFGQGTQAANTFMRRISGFEMTGIYISLALLPLAAWRWRHEPAFWVVLLFSIGMTLLYAEVVLNIGTLYRFRYGFIMTMVALGMAGGLSFLAERHARSA